MDSDKNVVLSITNVQDENDHENKDCYNLPKEILF